VEPSNGHVDPGLLAAAQTRTVTGVLTSRPTSRDIKIDGFSMGLNGVELIQARGGPARARPLSTARGPGRTLPPPSSAPRPPALCLGKPQTPRATSSASSCSVLPGAPAGRGAAAMPCSVQQAGPPPACAAWRAWRVRGGPRAGLLDRADDRAAVRPAGLQRQRQVQLPAVPGGAGGARAPTLLPHPSTLPLRVALGRPPKVLFTGTAAAAPSAHCANTVC